MRLQVNLKVRSMVGEFSTERNEPGIRRDCGRACRLTGGRPTGGDVQCEVLNRVKWDQSPCCTSFSFRIFRAYAHIRDRNAQIHCLPYRYDFHSNTAEEISLHRQRRRKQATGVSSRKFRNEDSFRRHLIGLEIPGDVSGLDRKGRKHTTLQTDEWPLRDQTRLWFSDSILPSSRMPLDCPYTIGHSVTTKTKPSWDPFPRPP